MKLIKISVVSSAENIGSFNSDFRTLTVDNVHFIIYKDHYYNLALTKGHGPNLTYKTIHKIVNYRCTITRKK